MQPLAKKNPLSTMILLFSSSERKVLKFSFCGHPMFVVRRQHLLCGHSRVHISCSYNLYFSQNAYLGEILEKFEFGSPWVIN